MVAYIIFDNNQNELLAYREHDEVQESVKELEGLASDLGGMVDNSLSSVKKFKKRLKDDFDILEHQLEMGSKTFVS